MKVFFMRIHLVAWITFVCLVPAEAQGADARRTAREKTAFDRGFDLFNAYDGEVKSRLEGWRIMREAAEAGDLKAKITVADFASGRISVNAPEEARAFFKPDLPLALAYYRDGSDAGNAHAKPQLAVLYSSGIGEPRHDSEKPHALLLSAAQQGNTTAMELLGERYRYGYGVERDLLEASRWLYEATKKNPGSRFEAAHFVDDKGEPKVQDSSMLDEFARVYSVYLRAHKFQDAAARAKLDSMKAEAAAARP